MCKPENGFTCEDIEGHDAAVIEDPKTSANSCPKSQQSMLRFIFGGW
jgi:hypothetical protein